jgi:GNAT superfamily N-acetyltransferase
VDVEVGLVPAATSYQLRQAVLRPHQRIDEVGDKVDDEPGTATFGATDRASGALVAVGTVFREPAPFDPAQAGDPAGAGDPAATWRLRWMATRHDVQGQGIGSMVLNAALDHVAAEGGDLLWCKARVGAIGFYERAGFSTWGDVWVVPGIGPHVVMWRRTETGKAT